MTSTIDRLLEKTPKNPIIVDDDLKLFEIVKERFLNILEENFDKFWKEGTIKLEIPVNEEEHFDKKQYWKPWKWDNSNMLAKIKPIFMKAIEPISLKANVNINLSIGAIGNRKQGGYLTVHLSWNEK